MAIRKGTMRYEILQGLKEIRPDAIHKFIQIYGTSHAQTVGEVIMGIPTGKLPEALALVNRSVSHEKEKRGVILSAVDNLIANKPTGLINITAKYRAWPGSYAVPLDSSQIISSEPDGVQALYETAKARLIGEILTLSEMTKNPDWDGNNAKPVTTKTFAKAASFISSLDQFQDELFLPTEIKVRTDGGVYLIWKRGRRKCWMNIPASGIGEFMYRGQIAQDYDSILFGEAQDFIDQKMLNHIRKLSNP